MSRHFEEAAGRHRHRVFSFALYSLGDREEAEDVTQEVLIRLWRHWDRLDTSTLEAWIARVTRNACIDAVRRRSAYRARVVAHGEEPMWHAASTEADPSQVAEGNELRQRIEIALTRLADPYRSILILREIQDLKYEQISDALELPLNTVKSYLHRGRRMLRDRLKETMPHGTR